MQNLDNLIKGNHILGVKAVIFIRIDFAVLVKQVNRLEEGIP